MRFFREGASSSLNLESGAYLKVELMRKEAMGRAKDKNRETLSESLTRERELVNMEGLIKAFRVST